MAFYGVLPEVPTMGQLLGRNLGKGISEGVGKGTDFAMQMALDKHKESQKSKWANELVGSFYGNKNPENMESQESSSSSARERPKILDIPDENIAALSLNRETAPFANILQQQKKEAKSEYETRIASQDAFDDMVNLTSKIGFSLISDPNYSVSKKRERSQFEASKGALIGQLKDRVNKGVLSNQKFNFIKDELLPSHKDSREVKIGKLKAVGKELGVDTSQLDELYPDVGDWKGDQKKPSKNMVKMRAPDGSEELVPKDKVKDAMKAGAWVVK